MDLLYTEKVDVFVVSSDSDFAIGHAFERGRRDLWVREQKTPKAFIAACDKFIYLEVLNTDDEKDDEDEQKDDESSVTAARVIVKVAMGIKTKINSDAEAFKMEIDTIIKRL